MIETQGDSENRRLCVSGRILWPDEQLRHGVIAIEGGRIQALTEKMSDLDASFREIMIETAADDVVAPGLIDVQVNGGFGSEVKNTDDAVPLLRANLPRFGVTGFFPTVTTLPLEEYASVTSRIVGQADGDSGSRVLGIHLEGPYLNPKRRGAHPAEWLRTPALDDMSAYVTHPLVRMVTLAPELPGGYDVISTLSERGLVVGVGHTEATEAETIFAIERGVVWGTHLFNAMRPLDHREPGIAGVLLTDRRIKVGLIADCIHVHPRLLRMAFESRGHAGIVLMTDGSAVSGLPPGEYQFGQRRIIMDGSSARLENGSLVGSILTPDQAVRNMVSFAGVSIQKALVMASAGPAKLVGRHPEVGSFRAGSYADIVVFDSALRVKTTIVGGKVLFTNGNSESV